MSPARARAIACLAGGLILGAAACGGSGRDEWEPGLRELFDLAVLEVPVDKIVFARGEQRLFSLVIGSATHVAESRAIVRLGIRAGDLRPEDVETRPGGVIVVRLPPVAVLDFSYQPETFVVRDDLSRQSFFRRLALSEREEIYRAAEADLRDNLPYDPMFERARLRLKLLVEAYLERYFDEVLIEFREIG